ncbi:MAG: alkaline phosphatase family protein [Candidatus Promineifilaceae bacterium]|nr:alkaline phosphatase family protein [Candidatus Promineifilaceae bacterium]
MKLLIVGFDGATFNLIRPWAEEGHLPNLASMMANGTNGDLLSTLPPVTSPAWPTFMTGCNPGKHGVFDFIQPHGENFTLVNATRIRQPTIWQRLSDAGHRVGVMNVPVTYPPAAINGFIISGLLSPKTGKISEPADLITRQGAQERPYRVAPTVQYKPGEEAEFIEDLYDLMHTRGQWALHLMDKEPVDVMMVHFIAMDIMKHALWRFMDHSHPRYEPSPYEHAIRDGYRIVDQYIGLLMDKLPPEASTIIMSDHGFGPLKNMVNLNVFFIEKGLMKLKRDPWTQLKALAFRWGITPSQAYQWIARLGLQNMVTRVSKNTRNNVIGRFLSFDSVDWERTIAYSMGHVGQVYLNVKGREPHGIVAAGEYKQKRQEVINVLQELVDVVGRPILSRVVTSEDAYSGPYASKGPDLHLILDEYNMIACPLFATEGKIMTHQIRGDSGCHRSEGIFLAQGPAIKKGVQLPANHIRDLAPTIMHFMGEQVPEVMDGRVLTEIFIEEQDVVYEEGDKSIQLVGEQGFSDQEASEVEERLRGLGYL